jgi:hypothetical protein
MMLSHFLELELRPDSSVEISPDGVSFQQLQHKLGWNTKILVYFSALELSFKKRGRHLIADRPQLRRVDFLSQHAISAWSTAPETSSKF